MKYLRSRAYKGSCTSSDKISEIMLWLTNQCGSSVSHANDLVDDKTGNEILDSGSSNL